MSLLVLSHTDVEAALPMAACIEAMRDALATLARDDAHNPLRFVVRAPRASGLLGLRTSRTAWPTSWAYGAFLPGATSRSM